MISPISRDNLNGAAAFDRSAEAVLWLGASMLRAGNTASQTRECIAVMAQNIGFDCIAVSFTLDAITVSTRRDGEWTTMTREIGPPGVNATRIAELEQLARTVGSNVALDEISAKLSEIDARRPRYTDTQIAAAVGLASSAFAFLNGCATPEAVAAGIGGGIGQLSRSQLSRHQVSQYGAASLSALAASSVYVLVVVVLEYIGFRIARHPPGFISSVLFLVPGFPLVAALLDLLQHQTTVAVTRMAYGAMIFLTVTFGLSVVIAVVRVDLSLQQGLQLAYLPKVSLQAAASFVGGCGFAMLFNNSPRAIFAVGLLALGGNAFRLALHDAGMMLAPATFFGAVAVGVAASFLEDRLDVPRIALTVPGIIIMVPGVYAFEMIVLFNRGQMLDALQASASCGFVMGAMAMGLAAAQFFSRKQDRSFKQAAV